MEIIQTIWNALSTENAQLTNILISPLLFIETYLYMLNFSIVLKIHSNTKQKIIYVLTFSFAALITMFFVPAPYYTFINIVICPICVFFILKTNVFNAIFSEIIIYIISLVFCTILVLFYKFFFNISSTLISLVPLYRITYSILFFIMMFLLYKYLKKHNTSFSFLDKIRNSNKTFMLNFIIGSLSIAIQFYIEYLYIDYVPFYIVIFSIIILFAYFIISLYSLARTNKLEITSEKLEEEKLYNQTLGLLYDNIRGFKHDYNNIVQGIGGYISTNNMEGLKKYYSEILDDCQKVNNLSLLSPEVINNPAIYSLLTSKYHIATSFGIKVNLEVFMDLSSVEMKIYELTRVLGVLIDNAIEAAKDCKEKEINIIIRKDNRFNKQLFVVENTYLNKDINIDEIFEKGKTSKTNKDAKNHGFGLWEVRSLVKKRKNLNLFTTKNDKYFKQQLEIYCAKS